jgi:predicted ATPase/serine/threonine protein kinase
MPTERSSPIIRLSPPTDRPMKSEQTKLKERPTTPQSRGDSILLSPGTQFGQYEILSSLGTGGMGEVYRARDTRLRREVAIKVLAGELFSDWDRLDRFEREARAASALNHPNIVTIYELGQVDSTHYIAMELVEGKTLRELLTAGLIPIHKVIQIATQVADGLAKAHEASIVHRDLKPENLMVSQDGLVKILDFGLAKLVELSSEDPSDLPTKAFCQTRPGVVMGTLGYMSPQQASGQPLDFRSDQFSFGLVLYEMVTGKRALQRSTEAGTLLAILQEEPEPIGSLNPEAPAPLCWAVERCLAKDPAKRYVSTRDLARDLATIRERLSELPLGRLETRPSNLPIQLTPFVGRDKEIAAVKEILLRQDVPLVTITGPGGVGKTRLGLKVAEELVDQFPGGVYFVPLGAVSDPRLIGSLIAQTLRVRETGGQAPLEALKEHLRSSLHKRMLLLLDNFEHLVSAAPMVAELLAIGPLKVLVTSRAPLHVSGEHEFPVPPLSLPDSGSLPSLEVLSDYSAVALFIQRAAAVKPDFELTEDNASAVTEICARLDGLPLAIELAAVRVKLLQPSALRTRLASRLQLLTGGSRDLPARQQTLRGAIDWSHDFLNAAEQKLFRRLSVFAGGCTLEEVEAVCNTRSDLGLDLLDGMASMVDQSLVQQVEQADGESRFVMLETIREYALEKLVASSEAAPTRRAHAAYCLVLAEEGAAEGTDALGTEWLDRFEIEHDNFRAALEWLIGSGDTEWGLRLGLALFRFWEMREYLAEGRDRLGKLLKLGGAEAPASKARARALFAAGVLAGEQGDYASADALTHESLEIARKLDDKHAVAVSLNALAVHARDRGDITASRSLFEESLVLWKECGDQLAVARSLSNLANVVKLNGDFARARLLYEDCLSIFRELGDRTGIAWSLNYQGDVARDQGDTEAARTLYEESLATFRELGDRWGIAGSLADLGNLARDQRDFEVAHSLYRESMRMFQELDHKRGIARLLECFACSAAAQAAPERSLRLAGAAAALRQTLGAPLTPGEQPKLERGLEPARQALTDAKGATIWLEGWVLPFEKAVDEALMPNSARAALVDRPATDFAGP